MIHALIVIHSLLKRLGSVFRRRSREMASKLKLFFGCCEFFAHSTSSVYGCAPCKACKRDLSWVSLLHPLHAMQLCRSTVLKLETAFQMVKIFLIVFIDSGGGYLEGDCC